MGIPFIAIVLLLDTVILKTWVIKKRDCWIVMGILMLLTLIFDQLLTGLPIVFYDETKNLGIKLWYAPIEDFTYSFAVVIGIGSLLTYLTDHEKAVKKDD
jgi:lycopene cyclase domain-containing protein